MYMYDVLCLCACIFERKMKEGRTTRRYYHSCKNNCMQYPLTLPVVQLKNINVVHTLLKSNLCLMFIFHYLAYTSNIGGLRPLSALQTWQIDYSALENMIKHLDVEMQFVLELNCAQVCGKPDDGEKESHLHFLLP